MDFPPGRGDKRESEIVRVVREFKAALMLREADSMRTMAQRWLLVEQAMEAQASALANEIAIMLQAGETVSQSRLLRLERYQYLLAQARAEVSAYARWAEEFITQQQREAGWLGIENAAQALISAYGRSGRVGSFFDLLPREAVESMAGALRDGSPLSSLLNQLGRESAMGISNSLVDAIASGINPRETAKVLIGAVQDGASLGLDRALRIARTEQLRAYRTMSQAQYKKSGVVTRYKRIATRDTRTCPACLFTDGQAYELDHEFEEHVNGRCALVPEVRGLREPAWTVGRDWFMGLGAEEQRQILGSEYFEAWQDGAFDLNDLVRRVPNATWGASYQVTPLSKLLREN
jgi:SPP1 gp7 family putative phage head morphogenesis protein